MKTELVTIIHLSDFHFFVHSNGKSRDRKEQVKFIKFIRKAAKKIWTPPIVRKLISGLNSHSLTALKALERTLVRIMQQPHSRGVVILQTGDVEAYGATIAQDGSIHFPALDYWDSICSNLRSQTDCIISIYGNHDIWPGTLPALSPIKTHSVEGVLRGRADFQDAFPVVEKLDYSAFRLEIYRLNTVCAHWLVNTFAIGQIKKDYPLRVASKNRYPTSGSQDPIDEMMALMEKLEKDNPAQIPIRVLSMHHSPHFFGKKNIILGDLCKGRLINKKSLVSMCEQVRFHLICAGHHHEINPSRGIKLSSAASGKNQDPLPNSTLQLVAGSATQIPNPHSTARPNFSVYRLFLDTNQHHIQVNRSIYSHLSDLDRFFSSEPVETVINDLHLR